MFLKTILNVTNGGEMIDTKLLICADDFGLTSGINKAIVKAYSKKAITMTSIVATGKYFDEAVEYALKYQIPCGVHLAIATEFDKKPMKPLLATTPCQESGAMYPNIHPYFKIEDEEMVYEEFCAQIEKVKSTGIRINHIDSHMHVYSKRVLDKVSMYYGVPCRDFCELGDRKCDFFHYTIAGDSVYEKKKALMDFIDNIHEAVNIIVTHPTMCIDEMRECVSCEFIGRYKWQTELRFLDLPGLLDEEVLTKINSVYKGKLSYELY